MEHSIYKDMPEETPSSGIPQSFGMIIGRQVYPAILQEHSKFFGFLRSSRHFFLSAHRVFPVPQQASCFFGIAMGTAPDVIFVRLQRFIEGAGEGDASMLSAGTPNADRQIVLSFAGVTRNEKTNQITRLPQKFAGIGITEDVIPHGLIESGEFGKLRHEIRTSRTRSASDKIPCL